MDIEIDDWTSVPRRGYTYKFTMSQHQLINMSTNHKPMSRKRSDKSVFELLVARGIPCCEAVFVT